MRQYGLLLQPVSRLYLITPRCAVLCLMLLLVSCDFSYYDPPPEDLTGSWSLREDFDEPFFSVIQGGRFEIDGHLGMAFGFDLTITQIGDEVAINLSRWIGGSLWFRSTVDGVVVSENSVLDFDGDTYQDFLLRGTYNGHSGKLSLSAGDLSATGKVTSTGISLQIDNDLTSSTTTAIFPCCVDLEWSEDYRLDPENASRTAIWTRLTSNPFELWLEFPSAL
jgi:hypothetical protein